MNEKFIESRLVMEHFLQVVPKNREIIVINQTDKPDLKRGEVDASIDVIILSPLIIFFNLNLCHYETVTLKPSPL